MANPEFSFTIDLSENTNLLRAAVGDISSEAAKSHLSDRHLVWLKQSQERLSHYPGLTGTTVITTPSGEIVDIGQFSPTKRSALLVSEYADRAERIAVQDTLKRMNEGTLDTEAAAHRIALFYDFSVGMRVVPSIIGEFENMVELKEEMTIHDDDVIAAIRRYEYDPLAVLSEGVTAHVVRFERGNKDSGMYIPEYLRDGIQHGEIVFTNAYRKLRPREEFIA